LENINATYLEITKAVPAGEKLGVGFLTLHELAIIFYNCGSYLYIRQRRLDSGFSNIFSALLQINIYNTRERKV
jgi:hypothetical protein